LGNCFREHLWEQFWGFGKQLWGSFGDQLWKQISGRILESNFGIIVGLIMREVGFDDVTLGNRFGNELLVIILGSIW
jgi:hypothetical protein